MGLDQIIFGSIKDSVKAYLDMPLLKTDAGKWILFVILAWGFNQVMIAKAINDKKKKEDK